MSLESTLQYGGTLQSEKGWVNGHGLFQFFVDNHGRDEEVIVEAGKCVKGLVEMIFGDIKVG